ncbi:type II toxin-antitoxin system RelE/ParE family toxin [Orrella dioscoreae]|uniref:type II toxin-antitoxin system RelE/ParE family toxin n=1 Tax=Orrella dioscoreae TaxID=1851544 RepID=UPI00082A08DC|nr:type II toxin-antitoxin system RelE/ParE family toxin [Orrella dioscoreae]
MSYAVAFAPSARADIKRLYVHLLERADTLEDLALAERALAAIETAVQVHLSRTPFIYRPAPGRQALRRELIIPFGATGYVALYEIARPGFVLVLAVRHQREQDYGAASR